MWTKTKPLLIDDAQKDVYLLCRCVYYNWVQISDSVWTDMRSTTTSVPINTHSSPPHQCGAERCQTIRTCACTERLFNRVSSLLGAERLNKRFFRQWWVTWWKGAPAQNILEIKFRSPLFTFFFVMSSKLQTLHHSPPSSRHNILIRNRRSRPDLEIHWADGCVNKL